MMRPLSQAQFGTIMRVVRTRRSFATDVARSIPENSSSLFENKDEARDRRHAYLSNNYPSLELEFFFFGTRTFEFYRTRTRTRTRTDRDIKQMSSDCHRWTVQTLFNVGGTDGGSARH